MDGFEKNNKIIILASTNFKESLDSAIIRPGRFDRIIEIPVPNFKSRI